MLKQINVLGWHNTHALFKGRKKSLHTARLPITADVGQNFASCFDILLESPASRNPLKTRLWTCPKLPKNQHH